MPVTASLSGLNILMSERIRVSWLRDELVHKGTQAEVVEAKGDVANSEHRSTTVKRIPENDRGRRTSLKKNPNKSLLSF